MAQRWLHDADAVGRDGVIARHGDGRSTVRVRRRRTAACVVTGFRSSGTSGLRALRLALYDGDVLVEVGRTTALRRAPARREAIAAVAAVSLGGPRGGFPGTSWVDLSPSLVCEVRFERLRGRKLRNAVELVRWLPDRDPRSCTIEQLGIPAVYRRG